jgi:prophage regulatory protein
VKAAAVTLIGVSQLEQCPEQCVEGEQVTPPTSRPKSNSFFADLGILEPDVELAKGDVAIRIHRLAEHRRLTADEAAAVLKVPTPELEALFRGRLATCSLDQLLRMLTWLGDDVEITIRPRLQPSRRGTLRVIQAAAVERPEDFEPVRTRGRRPSTTSLDAGTQPNVSADASNAAVRATAPASRDDRQLLNKHDVERMTSLDISTIYRRMAAGRFPQPVRLGRRRVAWRTSDIVQWQQDLEVGTETLRWKTGKSGEHNRGGPARGRRDQR